MTALPEINGFGAPPRRTVERLSASVVASVGRSAASFFTAVLLARALGPREYGDLTFLIASFASVSLLLDSGTSTGFFTLLARRPRGRHFFTVYGAWTFGVQMAGTLAVLALAPMAFLSKAWQGESRAMVILAFMAAFLSTQGWNSVIQLGEGQRRTFRVQLASTAQAVAHLALLGFAAFTGRLSVTTVLLFLLFEYALLITLLAPSLVTMSVTAADDTESVRDVIRAFVEYCRPIAVYGYVGFVYAFADRWLLQHFGGSVQQGIFGFAQQFGAISILATAAMMNVFWKEIAEARALGDLARLRELYTRSRRVLFFTAAWTSCLLIPWSDRLLTLTAGPSYAAGVSVFALMLLYPVHQSLGQLQGTFFVATGETRLYSSLGLVVMGISIVVTYFLLANSSATLPGLGLGALGLAAKLVGLQFIQVLMAGILISRKYNWPYDFAHQFGLLAILLVTSFAIRGLIALSGQAFGNLGQFLIAVVTYGAITGLIVWRYPQLAGIDRGLVRVSVRRLVRLVRP